MNENPLYSYLLYLNAHPSDDFDLIQKQSQSQKSYFMIPLSVSIPIIEHPQWGHLRVLDTHITCFSETSEESYHSDIHFTAVLGNELGEIKIHVYQDIHGRVCGFYSKISSEREGLIQLRFSDIKILYHAALPLIRKIRSDFSNLVTANELLINKKIEEFRYLIFFEESELAPQINHLRQMIETLNLLCIFNEPKYLRKLRHYEILLAEKIETLAQQELIATSRSAHSEELSLPILESSKVVHPYRNNTFSRIKENIVLLTHVLGEITPRVQSLEAQTLQIHPLYQRKLLESLEIYNKIQDDIFYLEEGRLKKPQQLMLQHFQNRFEILDLSLKTYCNEYFESMVLSNDFSDFQLITPLLERPKASSLIHLIRKQAKEILIDVINKFEISLVEPLFQSEPSTIIEHIIHHKNEVCFSAILEHVSIDFLQELPDGRPIGLLILSLNPVNSIRNKCFHENVQFQHRTFFVQLKHRILELLPSHSHAEELRQIESVIDLYQPKLGPRVMESSKMMQKVSDAYRPFFSGFSAQMEEKDFLKKERFIRLIQKYDELSRKQHERAYSKRAIRKHASQHGEFLSDFCSEETRRRLEAMMPRLTEEQAYQALETAYQVAVAYDQVIQIDDELEKKASLSIKKIKELTREKQELLERIEYLKHGPRQELEVTASKRYLVVSLAHAEVMSGMAESEQLATQSLLLEAPEEKPIECYAQLPGITPVHLEIMHQVRACIQRYCHTANPEFISLTIEYLDRLMAQLQAASLPAETLEKMTEFYVCETRRLFS